MDSLNNIIKSIDDFVWGIPLIVLIMACGIWLTIRCCGLQFRHLGKALKFMVKNEEGGDGEVTSFGALCTALSATIGTGNIVGCRRCNCTCSWRAWSVVLDDRCGFVWHGNKICRRLSGNQVSYH